MVMSNREVQNRVVQLDRYYSAEELRRAANYLNEAFSGPLAAGCARAAAGAAAGDAAAHGSAHAGRHPGGAEGLRRHQGRRAVEYVIAGETNLMGFAELSECRPAAALFEAFNEKHDILRLLDSCLRADGIQIFIGQESGYRILDDISVVTAPYMLDNRVVGSWASSARPGWPTSG
jgi:heat-inducible transcriptional repressor